MVGADELAGFDRVNIDRHEFERLAAVRYSHEIAGRGAGRLSAHRDAVVRHQNLLDLPPEVGDRLMARGDSRDDLLPRTADIVAPAGDPFRRGRPSQETGNVLSGRGVQRVVEG